MAEDKKSFLLYADMIHTVEKLPKEKAGELFMHILRYVNDQDPIAEDILIQIAFEPVKQQLKRDLRKWDATKEEASRAGMLGNLKRWNADLYDKVIAEKLSLDQAVEIAIHRRESLPDSKAISNVADVAVTVNATVTETVNDTVSLTTEIKNYFLLNTKGKITQLQGARSADNFIDHYSLIGWVNIKDWKRLADKWILNERPDRAITNKRREEPRKRTKKL